ncbi:MAG: DUF433 domain-containing protein [Acidobacteriaceae bacterium]|nr:DUF433 domain-containing protein [Acidobacteriaceae bacterium]MBV9296841.1 DUF433 domain-containing protein [Acidobacteriaceae bacterium]MBV9763665.1 DUF433 domain-containing protein [Acidobacteriaceae bacterium]
MQWAKCALVEIDPDKLGGKPVVRGTRVAAQTIVDDYEQGSRVEEIHENFPSVPISTIRKIIEFAHTHN